LGDARQRAADLGLVEPLFDLTSPFGIPGALNKFFDSFSQLSVNPNDSVARQSVIDLAGQVTQAFTRAPRASGRFRRISIARLKPRLRESIRSRRRSLPSTSASARTCGPRPTPDWTRN